MKLLHLGDLHLGKTLGNFSLIQDQEHILTQILSLALEHSVDAVLIAGDIYDKAVPSEAATELLNQFLSNLSHHGIRTYMISGNHDSDPRLNYGSTLFASSNVFISATYHGTPDKHTLSIGETEADIYLLPFVKASQVRHQFPDDAITSYEDAFRTILNHTEIDPTRNNILVAHQFVTGGSDPCPGGSESAATLSVGTVEKISSNLFQPFDYVALGHIHSPQQVGRETIRYAGSPLKYSLSEAHNDKSVPLITLTEDQPLKVDLLPLHPLRDVRHIKGHLKELLRSDRIFSPNDLIYATLTDEEVINDAMGIFQTVYPNTVKIDYDNSHTRELEQVDISAISGNRSFSELISEFYQLIYGCEISDEEMDVMRETARKAGVIHETD